MIEATCQSCHREFALGEILPKPNGTDGRCPACGFRFARHYVSVLPEVVADAEDSARNLRIALEKLRGMDPGFEIHRDKLIRSLAAV